MPKNRIQELRKARGLSSEQLAEKVGISQGHMSRIETGTRGLSIPLAERIAVALSSDVQSVIGLMDGSAPDAIAATFDEDAEPYTPQPGDLALPRQRDNIDPWRVKTNALSQMGIRAGDVVLVDISAESVEAVKPLQAVVAQLYDASGTLKATTLMRQFVPPNLLITNSDEVNALPLVIGRDDVHMKGVIVGIQRSLRG